MKQTADWWRCWSTDLKAGRDALRRCNPGTPAQWALHWISATQALLEPDQQAQMFHCHRDPAGGLFRRPEAAIKWANTAGRIPAEGLNMAEGAAWPPEEEEQVSLLSASTLQAMTA